MDKISGKALVLGPCSVAKFIAQDLADLGIKVECHEGEGRTRVSPSDPEAFLELRKIIVEFVSRTGLDEGAGACFLHPGTSVWAERPELAHLCRDLGVHVLAPPPRVLNLFGNKLNLIGEADRLGVPHLVLSFDPIHSVREFEAAFKKNGWRFPILLKSVRGRGTPGFFLVKGAEDLEHALSLWFDQLRYNLDEVLVFAERCLEGARHIIQPFARFRDGGSRFFPTVDASLQSRYRKIIEFCPASGVGPDAEKSIHQMSLKIADSCHYLGVGFFEFLVDSSRVFLVGGAARLNTGFPLWEKVGGVSAVACQVAALADEKIRGEKIFPQQWKMGLSLRLYAEDPLLQLPQPGVVREISVTRHWQEGDGDQWAEGDLNLNIETGSEVAPMGDGLVGLIFTGGEEQTATLRMAHRILNEFWIAGSLQTNDRFLSELLSHPWVKEGVFHAGFVDEEFVPAIRPSSVSAIRLFASVCAWLLEKCDDSIAGHWSVGDQWVRPDLSLLKWEGDPQIWNFEERKGVSGVVLTPQGDRERVCCFPVRPGRWQVRIGAWIFSVRHLLKKTNFGKLFALVTGRVHSILYRENTLIHAHEPLLIVESLQTLVPHALPIDVCVLKWRVLPEAWVSVGDELAEFEISSHLAGQPRLS